MDEQTDGRVAVLRKALTNRRLRRVLFSYLIFNVSEWAVYLTLLVWAYGEGGVRGASLIAVLQLVPSALLALPLSTLLLRFSRGIALLMSYAVQSAALLGLAAVLLDCRSPRSPPSPLWGLWRAS